MGTRPKHYTREFVNRAIRLCEEHAERPYSEIARDLGIGYATLYSWMKRAGKTKRPDAGSGGQTPQGSQTPVAMRAQIERLQQELDETKKQLEFAKKAAAFFAQQNK